MVRLLSLGSLFVFIQAASAADLTPIQPGSEAEGVAQIANQIYSVKTVKTATKRYKLVSMDSALNGSSGSTGILLVGDEVGGEAGYEAAFQLTPTDELASIKSARSIQNEVEITFSTTSGKIKKQRVRFDSKANTLKVR